MRTSLKETTEITAAFDEVFTSHSGADRRTAERNEYHAPLVIYPFHDEILGEPITLLLQDFSVTGLGALHTRPMLAGEEFLLRLPRGKARPVSVICSVAHCRPLEGGMFRIGAEFARVLTSSADTHPTRGTVRLEWLQQTAFAPINLTVANAA